MARQVRASQFTLPPNASSSPNVPAAFGDLVYRVPPEKQQEYRNFLASMASGFAPQRIDAGIPEGQRTVLKSQQKQPSLAREIAKPVIGTVANEAANQGLQATGMSAGTAGATLGAAKAVYDGYKILSSDATAEQKQKAIQTAAQDTGLNIATGGIYGGVKWGTDKLTGGKFSKTQAKLNEKHDKFLESKAGKVLAPGASLTNKANKKLFSTLFGEPKTQVEDNRWKKLQEQGIAGFTNNFQESPYVEKGQLVDPSKPADFVGNNDSGAWANNKFSQSRSESDLTGRDIWGYSAFGEKFGNRWMGTSEAARETIANEALKRGLVREHHGTVDIAWNPDLEKFAEEQFGKGPAPTPGPVRKPKSLIKKPSKKKESSDDEPFVPYVSQPTTGNILPGPAVTVAQGGPSPTQPQVVSPEAYAKLLEEIYRAKKPQATQPLSYLYGV